jgi:hypothetical protein
LDCRFNAIPTLIQMRHGQGLSKFERLKKWLSEGRAMVLCALRAGKFAAGATSVDATG